MSWLMTQMWVELLIAAVFGGAVGWGLHMLYQRYVAEPQPQLPPLDGVTDPEGRARIAELERQLTEERAEGDIIRRKSGLHRTGEDGPPPEGSLLWRNRHLESRVRFLEGKLADLESEAAPDKPREDHNDEATRLRWRNRYLEGRVKYLEEELVRTGGLHPASTMIAAPPLDGAARPGVTKPSEGDKPELFDAPRDGRADDLKLISGIGPKLEQKLNSIGIWHYSQVAAWTAREIDWVNAAISFRGRIEREKWVPQARALLEGAEPAPAEVGPRPS